MWFDRFSNAVASFEAAVSGGVLVMLVVRLHQLHEVAFGQDVDLVALFKKPLRMLPLVGFAGTVATRVLDLAVNQDVRLARHVGADLIAFGFGQVCGFGARDFQLAGENDRALADAPCRAFCFESRFGVVVGFAWPGAFGVVVRRSLDSCPKVLCFADDPNGQPYRQVDHGPCNGDIEDAFPGFGVGQRKPERQRANRREGFDKSTCRPGASLGRIGVLRGVDGQYLSAFGFRLFYSRRPDACGITGQPVQKLGGIKDLAIFINDGVDPVRAKRARFAPCVAKRFEIGATVFCSGLDQVHSPLGANAVCVHVFQGNGFGLFQAGHGSDPQFIISINAFANLKGFASALSTGGVEGLRCRRGGRPGFGQIARPANRLAPLVCVLSVGRHSKARGANLAGGIIAPTRHFFFQTCRVRSQGADMGGAGVSSRPATRSAMKSAMKSLGRGVMRLTSLPTCGGWRLCAPAVLFRRAA